MSDLKKQFSTQVFITGSRVGGEIDSAIVAESVRTAARRAESQSLSLVSEQILRAMREKSGRANVYDLITTESAPPNSVPMDIEDVLRALRRLEEGGLVEVVKRDPRGNHVVALR